MTVEEIADLLYVYAYSNRHNPQFFRDIETEILERDLELVPIHCVGKILQAYSYSNLGSAIVYQKIGKTIKITQHEIKPLTLAKYAYLFSKASENIKSGFGVYQIALK